MTKTPIVKPELSLSRVFSSAETSPYDQMKWERRTASVTNAKGETIFEQKDVEVPEGWSQQATNILASKYFYGKLGTPDRETSVRQVIDRVVDTVVDSGAVQGYYKLDSEIATTLRAELKAILLFQKAAFNSPVWFNVGIHRYEPKAQAEHWYWHAPDEAIAHGPTGYHSPQCSACFINAVDDSMDGIMELAKTEAMLFKFGSGTGTNFSTLRSSKEMVSGGGQASGPLSFMRGLDAFAGVIKSGGKTRRAAKMAILNADHPDIEQFISCKLTEERKAHALMAQGYDGTSGPDSEAYSSIFYQNANNSVRVTDEFMESAAGGDAWALKAVKDGHVVEHVNAAVLLRKIAEAAWACGDPGMQFDTTINRWHTCPNSGRQNATNPCSEYSFLDDSSCNLASINLLRFLRKNGTFDVEAFKHTVDVMILAQDILVDLAGYPTRKIAQNSHDFRPLGLGYANLGALLMALGLAYDSDAGRAYAACITALMSGEAYRMSAVLAGALLPLHAASQQLDTFGFSGACPGWFPNKNEFLTVVMQHQGAARTLEVPKELRELWTAANDAWDKAYDLGKAFGYRNAKVTVLAPTGTIGFLMDCDTTGIEPELGLIKYKRLVGGGLMKIVNETVGRALNRLGYKGELAESILKHIDETGTVEGSDLADGHLSVFDTAFKPAKGARFIHYSGHIRMMGAVQPFLSGAISKTVNLPAEATVEDIEQAYVEGWRLGLKAIAVYRDRSKKNQVLTTTKDEIRTGAVAPAAAEFVNLDAPPKATRHKLPDTRPSVTHKIAINGHEGYVNVGLYGSGDPGECFFTMAKGGSTINGMMGGFATAVSIGLQHGVPLQTYVNKFSHTRFEPSGWSREPGIGYAKSILDYWARWMEKTFIKDTPRMIFESVVGHGVPMIVPTEEPATTAETPDVPTTVVDGLSGVMEMGDSPACPDCGNITVRNGSCYKCIECGGTTGCS